MTAEQIIEQLIQESLTPEEQQALSPLIDRLKPRLRARIERRFYERCRHVPTPDYALCFGLSVEPDETGQLRTHRLVVRSRCHILNPAFKEYAVYYEDTSPETLPRAWLGATATQRMWSGGWFNDPDEARIQFLEDNILKVRLPHEDWFAMHGQYPPETLECWAQALLEQERNAPNAVQHRLRWFALHGDRDLLQLILNTHGTTENAAGHSVSTEAAGHDEQIESQDNAFLSDEYEARRRLHFTPDDWQTVHTIFDSSVIETCPILLFDPSLSLIFQDVSKRNPHDTEREELLTARAKRHERYQQFYRLFQSVQTVARLQNALVRFRWAHFDARNTDTQYGVQVRGRLKIGLVEFVILIISPEALRELQRAVLSFHTPDAPGKQRWLVDPVTIACAVRRNTVATSSPWDLCWPPTPESQQVPLHSGPVRSRANARKLKEYGERQLKEYDRTAPDSAPLHAHEGSGLCCLSCAFNRPCESSCPAHDPHCHPDAPGGRHAS